MQKISSVSYKARRVLAGATLLAFISVFSFSNMMVPRAQADNIDAQINALMQQNSNNQNVVNDLQSKAVSYQDAINKLRAQIENLQGQINNNTAKQAGLQEKINANKIELERQRLVLGENIKVMYVDGQPSTIEMLASSKNLSDFVDKEEYRTSVQTKIQSTLTKIATSPGIGTVVTYTPSRCAAHTQSFALP